VNRYVSMFLTEASGFKLVVVLDIIRLRDKQPSPAGE
jgi:hypothetical protein